MAKIIEAENLTKIYKGKVKAVDHISFSVEEGEVFGFLGPNGAGKTTTIKMLNTLAMITEGRATVVGHDVGEDPGAVRKSICVVPQELTADDELKGVENLILAARLHHVRGDGTLTGGLFWTFANDMVYLAIFVVALGVLGYAAARRALRPE
jgi:ABC-2 type transport system ATP-binding protein